MTLTLNTAIKSFCKTLSRWMMHHETRSGCKRTSNSADIEKNSHILTMSHHCDLDLEDSKSVFCYHTLAHNDVSQYQVWLQKVQCRAYYIISTSGWTFTESLIIHLNHCDLDLEQSHPVFSQDFFANNVCLQKDQQFRKYLVESRIYYMSPHSDLDP